MENTEIWNKARSLKLGKEFLNGLDELLTSLESDNKQLIITDVSKSVNCEHPMSERADIVNSSATYCLKCSTTL